MKYLKYGTIGLLSAVAFIYLSLAGLLWWSEYNLPKTTKIESLSVSSLEPHKVALINSGAESLKRRITAIENAQDSLELEYFIYELDLASQLMTQKLIEAAKIGIKVRILVDFSAPVFKLGPEYAAFLKRNGISVKYYNTASVFRFITSQHRSHRKFLIADSDLVITGGRNIGNDYFDLSSKYNFVDSDIEIKGPIAKEIRKSFDTYWESPLASPPESLEKEKATNFINAQEVAKLEKTLQGMSFETPEANCEDIDFVTDAPGGDLKNRRVYSYLEKKLKKAKSSLHGESPYFVLRSDGLELIKGLTKRGVKVDLLTNGLYSTDAFYTVAPMLGFFGDLKDSKINPFIYNGSAPYKGASKRWGLHAKRAVIDKKHTLIGTYNIDPRSANYNSEVLISCNNNKELARIALESMRKRKENAHRLFQNKNSPYEALTKGAGGEQKIKMLLSWPVARLFSFLL